MKNQSPFERELYNEVQKISKESDERASVSYISRELNISRDWARNIFKEMERKGEGYRPGVLRQVIKHRYAAWCASTAAKSPRCRFAVKEGVEIIESSKSLVYFSHNWRVPFKVADFDLLHRNVRETLIKKAETIGITGFTHGVAAKLINVYLKTLHIVPILAMYEQLPEKQQEKLNIFHPPIDGQLLKSLIKKNVGGKKEEWKKLHPWTEMDSKKYEKAISLIREVTEDKMWSVECHWIGYR
ncbi:hypothetical protein H6785_02480 [Candidatus Nomurabacteria bacterium]|nr:hypothetical protein [Candidatus Nomurabacteria bacterium]